MYRLAHDVARGDGDFEGAVARLKGELNSRCGEKIFEGLTSADDDHIRSAYGKRFLRYFLYEYETALAAKKNTDPKVSWEELEKVDLQDTIEYILPQTIEGQDYWTARFGEHEQDLHKQYRHDLGNLTLTKWNAKYLNKPFPKKKGRQGGDTEFCYAKAPFFSEQELTDWDEWTPTAIEQRRSRLLEWARERWRVDFGDTAGATAAADPPDEEQDEDPESAEDAED